MKSRRVSEPFRLLLVSFLVLSLFGSRAASQSPPGDAQSLDVFQLILVADGDVVTRDMDGRAALASAFSRFQAAAFDKKIKAGLASAYIARSVPLDVLKIGRDNILLATPSFSHRQVGTVFKKWEVTTTVIFADLVTFQPIRKTEAVVRNPSWSQAYSEGIASCLSQLLAEHPGFNVYKTRTYRNSLIEGLSKEMLWARFMESNAPHALEGPWRIDNDSHFGKFEVFISVDKNQSGEAFLAGTIVDPLYSGRTPRRMFISMDVDAKDGVRNGLVSEENMSIVYSARVRTTEDAIVIQLEDAIWKTLPPVILRRPQGWARAPSVKGSHEGAGSAPASRSEEQPVVSRASGSGFLVSSTGIVATNFHVIEDAKVIRVSLPEIGNEMPASVLATDPRNDLALVRIDNFPSGKVGKKLPYAVTTTQAVQPGARVFTIGYPLSQFLGSKPKFSDGSVSAITGPLDDPRLLQVSASIQPGNSGGPLFSADGNIIGVVVASANAKVFFETLGIVPQNVNFAVKSEHLLSLLFSERIRMDVEAGASKPGASPEQIAENVLRYCAYISIEK
jgi:S1-C subfamily serine protease